ncbi:hypothetical protein ACOSQ2_020772 [Xanthoceras sorbifolium]
MPDEETAKYDRGKQHSIFQKMLYKRTDITRKHNKRWNKREHFNNFTRMSSSSRVYNKNHPRQPVTVLEIQSLGMGRVIKKLAATVTRKSRLLLTILKKWQPRSRRLLMQPKPKAVRTDAATTGGTGAASNGSGMDGVCDGEACDYENQEERRRIEEDKNQED